MKKMLENQSKEMVVVEHYHLQVKDYKTMKILSKPKVAKSTTKW